MVIDGCPDEERIVDLLDGACDDQVWLAFDAHIDGCERCRRLVALAATDVGAEETSALHLLPSGVTLSRYVIRGVIGSGAMGIVYAADDPELERQVAVKLLWPALHAVGARELRVLREAQAMARLTHPNVVTVHDVGMVDGRVFVVMELVQGTTLRGWLAEARPWREVLSVFRRAGSGLSAAHAAGLVHRDFKPDNVLVDPAGRVLVTDFGLARSAAGGEPSPGVADALVVDRVTRTGAIVGTPAYMAPEQLDGGAVDQRSDVFSFCVALYEALYRERPFAGDTVAELRDAILRGRVREPPRRAQVPARVRQIVLRGLVSEPSLRPASIDEITDALDRDPAASRRRAAVAGVAALAVAVAALAVGPPLRAHQMVCKGAERKLAGVWDGERRQAVSRAILAGDRPGAATTVRIVESTLDRYTRDWVAMRGQACEATHVVHEQSEALLDRRMGCLDERLEEVRALADLLSRPDDQLADSAAKAAYSLSSLRPCADAEALLASVPPPADPGVRAEVERLRLSVAQVKAMKDLGRYRDGERLAADLAARAQPIGYAPLDADVRVVWGELLELVGDYPRAAEVLREALRAAERGRDRKLAARVLILLDWMAANGQGDYARAHEYGGHAEAILHGLGGDTELEALLARSEGGAFMEEDRLDEAEKTLREALEKQRLALGEENPAYGTALVNFGRLLREEERYTEALEQHEHARKVLAETVGDHHPLYGMVLCDVADDLRLLGRLDEARPIAERALAITDQTVGPEHAYVALATQSLGLVELEQRQYADAVRHLQRALAITEKIREPSNPFIAWIGADLAMALTAQGRGAEALVLYRRALDASARLGHPRMSAQVQSWIGATLLSMKLTAEALVAYETALAWQEAHERSPREVCKTRIGAAQALWATGGDRERARHLAAQAIASCTEAGPGARNDLSAAQAWLDGAQPTASR